VKDYEEEEEQRRPAVAGTNPSTGVVVYYQLPAKVDTSRALSLEILDDAGRVVRRYSSKEEPGFVHYPGGPSEDPVLPFGPGLNRMVWDMRYPTLPGVPKVFIEGEFSGRKAAPGVYSARLRYDSVERAVKFTVLADPRIKASAAEYAEQQEWSGRVEEGIREIHESVLRIRKVRQQVSEVVGLVGSRADWKQVADSGRRIADRLLKWEEELVQNKAQSNDDVINFINELSADYVFLKGEMDVNIPYVTAGQKERYGELQVAWKGLKGRMDGLLEKDVAGFNALCRGKGVERVVVPEK